MKFYRMDSDQWEWKAWRAVYQEVGRHQFAFAKALFHDFYSFINDTLCPTHSGRRLWFVPELIADNLRCKPDKVIEYLEILGRHFRFEVAKPCGEAGDKFFDASGKFTHSCKNCDRWVHVSPTRRVFVTYPNLWRKQRGAAPKSTRTATPAATANHVSSVDSDLSTDITSDIQNETNSSADQTCGEVGAPLPLGASPAELAAIERLAASEGARLFLAPPTATVGRAH